MEKPGSEAAAFLEGDGLGVGQCPESPVVTVFIDPITERPRVVGEGFASSRFLGGLGVVPLGLGGSPAAFGAAWGDDQAVVLNFGLLKFQEKLILSFTFDEQKDVVGQFSALANFGFPEF